MKKPWECARCNEEGEQMGLLGGYKTRLCTAHFNEWDVYCKSHPLFGDMKENEVRTQIATLKGLDETAVRLVREGIALSLKFREEVARPWAEGQQQDG